MRATHLQLTDIRMLEAWGREVSFMFRGEMPYLVGSSLDTSDWRDIDVRLILRDKNYGQLKKRVNIQHLGLSVSLWGQRATGLPVDFQIQRMTAANESHDGRRHPLAMPKQEYDA